MLTIAEPSLERVESFLNSRRDAGFTYDQIGATRDARKPAGFDHDSLRIQLGQGRAVFDVAIHAFRNWQMFPQEMATVVSTESPIRAGEVIGVVFRTPVVWSVSPCRIVYVIDERDEASNVFRFGFANGTLLGHVEMGEERFLLEWDRVTDEVWYSIVVFSKPAHVLVKIGYPYARFQQAKFRRLSATAMLRAVESSFATSCWNPPNNSSRHCPTSTKSQLELSTRALSTRASQPR